MGPEPRHYGGGDNGEQKRTTEACWKGRAYRARTLSFLQERHAYCLTQWSQFSVHEVRAHSNPRSYRKIHMSYMPQGFPEGVPT